MASLEDRFHVIKEIGDGSFGNVVLARVRSAGASLPRKGVMQRNATIAIKTMKKTFSSFDDCAKLREVIFLRSLPQHPHLVPALDVFLDPLTKKLHICMEYMDGNLYQLMKARDHKCLDPRTVKSILFQILSGLDHIHAHHFFHRDIKPENILVSSTGPIEASATTSGNGYSRYTSHLVTPPSTPTAYTVKIADFGLARETHSKRPYTTYVSTRWYRAPEVLLRAGSYSAPVDMWAVGAMAVEIATLKPLFPGGNEVDQVWRICEIMGSPGNWYNKSGGRVGGGEWRDGVKLAQRLGFSFPKMAPHSLETVLPQTQWPLSLSHFVTWCLMWDPKTRPTSTQALTHEYFSNAVDPLRPKSSTSRILGRRQSDRSFKSKDADSPTLTSRPSWFRRSLIGGSGRDNPTPVPETVEATTPTTTTTIEAPKPVAVAAATAATSEAQIKAKAAKRATWANGAPMPILPSIRPVSPLSNSITARGNSSVKHSENATSNNGTTKVKINAASSKKVGRQLSVNSNTNHYSDINRQETEKPLNGGNGSTNITANASAGQKESFFSHLRKRARRLSGRNQAAIPSDDVEANAASAAWSNRSSMMLDINITDSKSNDGGLSDLDKALQNVRYSLDTSVQTQQQTQLPSPAQESPITGPVSSRTRRALQASTRPMQRYETPEEEDELLQEVLYSTSNAAEQLFQTSESNAQQQQHKQQHQPPMRTIEPYPTPSPTARRDGQQQKNYFGVGPGTSTPSKAANAKEISDRQGPTPPYDDSQWPMAGIYGPQSSFQ